MSSTKAATKPIAFRQPKTKVDENFERILRTATASPIREKLEPRVVTLSDEQVDRLKRKLEAGATLRKLVPRAKDRAWLNAVTTRVRTLADAHHELKELFAGRDVPPDMRDLIASVGDALVRFRDGG